MPRKTDVRTSTAALALGLALAAAAPARANPRPLPFTYQSETLPQGAMEVEQFVDLVPVRAQQVGGNGENIWFLASEFQTEFELGLTDRLELGLYVSFVPQPNADYANRVPPLLWGNGLKQRLRYRLADPEAWPIDVALYGEVTENEREIELEGKIILQRRFGRVRVITNLWVEHEFYFDGRREWVFAPTLGATAELSPRYHVGLESWSRAEYPVGGTGPGPRAFNLGPHVYAGPTFLANFGKLWWSTGAYLRLTDFDRTVQSENDIPDTYGHFWFRTIVGLSF